MQYCHYHGAPVPVVCRTCAAQHQQMDSPNEKYFPRSLPVQMVHASEECAEVIKNVCKAQRFGLENYNPDVSEHERETNREAIIREANQAIGSLSRMVDALLKAAP